MGGGIRPDGFLIFLQVDIKEPLINSPARLAASLLRSAARENLDLAPLNLRFSRLHLTKNMLAIR
ncbi:MAG: hypothetical protein IJU12_08365, partial [Clostridia bacterium]|nr:hypothetical protein [Clostridia bacterium]